MSEVKRCFKDKHDLQRRRNIYMIDGIFRKCRDCKELVEINISGGYQVGEGKSWEEMNQ